MTLEEDAKDNAARCLHIAHKCWTEGDKAKAIKFAEKSLRFCPTAEGAAMLRLFQSDDKPGSTPPENNSSSSRKRPTATTQRTKTASNPGKTDGPKDYTPEQQAAARAIQEKSNYYDILGLPKGSGVDQVKRAYRKAALKFHPDKNRAPEAEEAFKLLSKAYTCLSEPSKKEFYDQYGQEEDEKMAEDAEKANQDLTEEQLFALYYDEQGARHFFSSRYKEKKSKGVMAYAHWAPVLFLFLFSLLHVPWGGGGAAGHFRLESDDVFVVERETAGLKPTVTYYVSSSFEGLYGRDPRAVSTVESLIRVNYKTQLGEQCEEERADKRTRISEARTAKDKELMKELGELFLPTCHTLKTFDLKSSSTPVEAL